MRKDNWRFEALARAKIVRQEEEDKVKTISQLAAEAAKEMEGSEGKVSLDPCTGCYQDPCICFPDNYPCDPD